jgi:hypothetical protein
MKRQIFSKENEINSKKISEHSPKTKHSFNYIDSANNNYKYRSNEKPRNRENEKNNKSNNKIKKGKMGKLEYQLEPRNILLIPDNFNIKNNNIKICEKELLKKEKNYFISESNFQLIKDALNEKEKSINNLKLIKEKNDKQISLLEEENKKLEEANNELILQIQKNNIYFNKMYQLLKYVFNYYNSFNDPKIKKFIKEQNLESILNKKNISSKNENQNNNNNSDNTYKDNSINYLFDINNDSIIKELEKYKKMYNDIRKELNYITNLKSKEKENQDDNIKQILENQKKINELKLENQNYMKENTYLKLLCKNIALEKKIGDIDDNSEIIEQLEKNLENEKNKNNELIKENEILKNKIESQLKELNLLKSTMNKNNQEILLKNSELEKIKLELEKLKQKINDGNSLKSKEELKNKNNVYSRKMNLEMNTINRTKFKKLKIENTQNLFYPTEKNELKLEGQNNEILTQINNVDLLMLLYNKSKLNETYIQNK